MDPITRLRSYKYAPEGNVYNHAHITAADIIHQCDAAAASGHRPPLTATERRSITHWADPASASSFVPRMFKTHIDVGAPPRRKGQSEEAYQSRVIIPTAVESFERCRLNQMETQWCQDTSCGMDPRLDSAEAIDAYIAAHPGAESSRKLKYCKDNFPKRAYCAPDAPVVTELFPKSDFKIISNAGGGNCFFLSVMISLFVEEQIRAGTLLIDVPASRFNCAESMVYRRNAVAWLRENLHELYAPWAHETVEELIIRDEGNVEKYLRDMEKATTQAGQPEYWATAYTINRSIYILRDEGGMNYVTWTTAIIPGTVPIYMKHTGGAAGGHYETLVPKSITSDGVVRAVGPKSRIATTPVGVRPHRPLRKGRLSSEEEALFKGWQSPEESPKPAATTTVRLPAASKPAATPVARLPAAPKPIATAIARIPAIARLPAAASLDIDIDIPEHVLNTLDEKTLAILRRIHSGELTFEQCIARRSERGGIVTGILSTELEYAVRKLGIYSSSTKAMTCQQLFAVVSKYPWLGSPLR